MQKRTTLADREEIVALKRSGLTYAQTSDKTGWSKETVRRVWRAYRDHGSAGLLAQPLGRPATGPLSTFDPLVRYVALRLKLAHRKHGPDIILADMRLRPASKGLLLPSPAVLGRYFQQFGERLVTPRRHLQLPRESTQLTPARVPHDVWQLDFDEGLHLPPLGWVNVFNITDMASGMKPGSFVHDAGPPQARHLITWEQMRDDLRDAFCQWGLPSVIRTDRDCRLVAPGDYPVPMCFTLWLVGLGIRHETIRRVTQNGQVERSHRTWEDRLLYPPPAYIDTILAFQEWVRYQIWRMNAVLPSRARNCRRRPPLLAYPEARHNSRYFSREEELAIFDMERVYEFLAEGRWLRRVSAQGQFSFQNDLLYVGKQQYARTLVVVTFDPLDRQFIVKPGQLNQELMRFCPDWLSQEVITGLQGV
jgi:hypothetical protein